MRGITIIMITGLVIPCHTDIPMFEQELGSLADYQATISGYIETVHVSDRRVVMVADEDGKAKRLPINRRATILWWLLNPGGPRYDVLVGDVIVVGPTVREEFSDVPTSLVALLLYATQYQVRVLLSRESNAWMSIGIPIDNFFEAAMRALHLMKVWNPPTEVKVVAV